MENENDFLKPRKLNDQEHFWELKYYQYLVKVFEDDFKKVYADKDFINHSPQNYYISSKKDEKLLTKITFQKNSPEDMNGCFMEDLIKICIKQLELFQDSKMKCKENEQAKEYLIKALKTLEDRKNDRIKRNVIYKVEK